MRRPMSIMRAARSSGSVEILYKEVGAGSAALAAQRPGMQVSMLGPIGRPFTVDPGRPRALLIGGGVGIPPVLFLAEDLGRRAETYHPVVIMGSEVPFPFELGVSSVPIAGIPDSVNACLSVLEGNGIASRLTSRRGYPGCHDGYVTDLARDWLTNLRSEERRQVSVFACGPTPMLRAVAALAREFDLPCQVALEEYMACGVGGCAGCAVRVRSPAGDAMRRVCVDGPVFEAEEVFFDR